jgi:hypothetical protein
MKDYLKDCAFWPSICSNTNNSSFPNVPGKGYTNGRKGKWGVIKESKELWLELRGWRRSVHSFFGLRWLSSAIRCW